MKPIFAQILVGVIVGVITGLIAGSGTAYVLVRDLEQELKMHIVENQSTEAQIRRDIVRLEQSGLDRRKDIDLNEQRLNRIERDIAVIADFVRRYEAAQNRP